VSDFIIIGLGEITPDEPYEPYDEYGKKILETRLSDWGNISFSRADMALFELILG
jgi:hypothetical protein